MFYKDLSPNLKIYASPAVGDVEVRYLRSGSINIPIVDNTIKIIRDMNYTDDFIKNLCGQLPKDYSSFTIDLTWETVIGDSVGLGKDVHLKGANLSDAIIADNSEIELSTLNEAVVYRDCKITSSIMEDCTIMTNCNIDKSSLKDSIIKTKCVIENTDIENSTIGKGARIRSVSFIRNSIMFDDCSVYGSIIHNSNIGHHVAIDCCSMLNGIIAEPYCNLLSVHCTKKGTLYSECTVYLEESED